MARPRHLSWKSQTGAMPIQDQRRWCKALGIAVPQSLLARADDAALHESGIGPHAGVLSKKPSRTNGYGSNSGARKRTLYKRQMRPAASTRPPWGARHLDRES